MSFCREEGKDKIVITTREDLNKPCKANIKIEDPPEQQGAILPDGSINWDCPCISRDLTGPCGYEMRQALSCFSTNAASTECHEKHLELQECLKSHAGLYPWINEKDNDDGDKSAENMILEAEEKS